MNSVLSRQGLRFCISNKLPGKACTLAHITHAEYEVREDSCENCSRSLQKACWIPRDKAMLAVSARPWDSGCSIDGKPFPTGTSLGLSGARKTKTEGHKSQKWASLRFSNPDDFGPGKGKPG